MLSIILLVCSCNNVKRANTNSAQLSYPFDNSQTISNNDGCYKSFKEFAYTLSDTEFPEIMLPMAPWEIVSSMPSEYLEGHLVNDVEIVLARSIDGTDEVWSILPVIYPEPQIDSTFGVYTLDTQEWRKIPAKIENTNLFVQELFLTNDGTVWGKTAWEASSSGELSPNQGSILSKFNEQKQRFELDPNAIEIPFTNQQLSPEIILDKQDVFWIIVHRDGIYKYDSNSETILKQADLRDLTIVVDSALAPDGTIYLQEKDDEKLYSKDLFFQIYEGMFFKFSPDTGIVEQIEIPDLPWPIHSGMIVTNAGELWLGAIGQRKMDETWDMMHPDPEGYFDHAGDYNWAPPRLMLESSDGRLWYQKYLGASLRNEGTAWYNPNTGDGCMFTNVPANIIEDDQQQLWMIADGKLYRYELE